jgi:hypothetical protein
MQVTIPIPTGGAECRISKKLAVGWKKVSSTSATGGCRVLDLEPGEYKRSTWFNGICPSVNYFSVTEEGEICWQEE